MKERPILFSTPMVRALMAGRKTQTRRVVKPQPSDEWTPTVGRYYPTIVKRGQEEPGAEIFGASDEQEGRKCPYGQPGDRLWVREAWQSTMVRGHERDGPVRYRATQDERVMGHRWIPGIHMPRWAARVLLTVTKVRVERLQEITCKDIIAEGAVERAHDDQFGHNPVSAFDGVCYLDLKSLWAAGWNSINGKNAPFASNPWVWVVEFKRS